MNLYIIININDKTLLKKYYGQITAKMNQSEIVIPDIEQSPPIFVGEKTAAKEKTQAVIIQSIFQFFVVKV